MRNTKNITTGAITVGLTALLALGDQFTTGAIMSFISLPLILYGFYFPIKDTVTVYVTAVLMSFVLTGGYLPSIITMAGYGLMGLALVFARKKQLNKKLTYLSMYVAAIPVYGIMISFFGQYFGVSYIETYNALLTMLPEGYNTESIKLAVILSILLLPLMESFIMKISSQLVLNSLTKSKKFRGPQL